LVEVSSDELSIIEMLQPSSRLETSAPITTVVLELLLVLGVVLAGLFVDQEDVAVQSCLLRRARAYRSEKNRNI
jgi:hypothetical protein